MQRITKKNGEEYIIKRFTEAYALTCGINLVNISPREIDKPPDFETTIKETGERIGIEVTGLYQNNREAKINFSEIPLWDAFSGSLDKIASALNRLLKKKALKSYKYEFEDRMLLAIWVGSIIYHSEFDFRFISNQIEVPESKFNEIWLILKDEKGDSSLLLLTLLGD